MLNSAELHPQNGKDQIKRLWDLNVGHTQQVIWSLWWALDVIVMTHNFVIA